MSYLERWGIDDPVGAISVHGVAGILGLAPDSFTEQAIGTAIVP